jgi:riboflavin kinase/FMN adenylyltransferase
MIPAEPSAVRPFHVVERLEDFPAALSGGIVAIGNFDGAHRGHQAVLAAARDHAHDKGLPAYAMTFEPHPRSVFRPDSHIFRLTPPHAKARLMRALGLDGIVVVPFDRTFAEKTAETFVAEILVERLGIAGAVVGWDFHFGKGRGGSPIYLSEAGLINGFPVQIVEAFADEGGATVSSSRIRDALAGRELGLANGLLGYRWFVEAEVIHGDKRGRDLGFPTANMRLDADCRLAHGVYAVTFSVDGVTHHGVANYGRRPQFDDGPPLLETYLFDFRGDLYGKTARVGFVSYLRPEARFPSVDALVAQMELDKAEARTLLATLDPGTALDRALADLP